MSTEKRALPWGCSKEFLAMGETLTESFSGMIREEGLRVVNLLASV